MPCPSLAHSVCYYTTVKPWQQPFFFSPITAQFPKKLVQCFCGLGWQKGWCGTAKEDEVSQTSECGRHVLGQQAGGTQRRSDFQGGCMLVGGRLTVHES